jgi:hypothetical protein
LEKEITMKTESWKGEAGKVTGWPLVALVLAGGIALTVLADLTGKTGVMPRLFVFFLGAIIVVQIIPALMLLSAMFKGVASMFTKQTKVTTRK